MPKTARFWCNVGLIGLAHAVVITGLIRWSRKANSAPTQSVVWFGGGTGDGVMTGRNHPSPAPATKPTPQVETKIEQLKESAPEQDRPILTSAPSDIHLPMPQVSPTPIASATPARTPASIPTPRVKTTPRQTPKPKPRPTPKPSPKKIILAKASPKPSPKMKSTPVAAAEENKIEQPAPAKDETDQSDAATAPGSASGHAGGAGSESQFGWYGSMLHDRFYSEWAQPTSLGSSSKASALVKIRIEKDGRVSSFEIIRPSGTAELDQSVAAVAKRVTSVDPLPDGLGNGGHYDIKISFELSSE